MLERILLKDFRSHATLDVSFTPGINLILGNNGQGKTNLLEALFFLSTGASFRTRRFEELIRKEAPAFHLEAYFQKEGVRQSLKVSFDGKTRRILHNDTPSTRFSSLLGHLPHVLFAPEDISLLMGEPSDRRRFLNIHLSLEDRLYMHHLIRYTKAIQHRNALLRAKSIVGLDPWEELLSTSGAYLIHKRREMVEKLKPLIEAKIQLLTQEKESLTIRYISHPTSKELSLKQLETTLRNLYQKERDKERELGMTLVGPHRDDLKFFIHHKEVRSFASEGQKRILLAALKLAEWEELKEATHTAPLLSIDDIAIHLDGQRAHALFEQLQQIDQVFLTSPHPLSISAANTIQLPQEVS